MRGLVAAGALALLAGCGGGGGGAATAVVPPTAAPLDVTPCLTQAVDGRTIASIVVPDVLTFDVTKPNGFPNGRYYDDPVIDLELNALMLDLRTVPVDTLARRPLNPGGPDRVGDGNFPYIGAAFGGAPAAVPGAGYVFRTEPASAFTRIDRMGNPAVATVLVSSSMKNPFNDDSPPAESNGKFVAEFASTLTTLATQLQDDWAALGLKICAVPKT